jgi:uncharacterized Zn finger protein/superfamily II DNA or RNA helicase
MAIIDTYGITPWGRRFAEALDGFDVGGRLSRGASYANTGKVLSLNAGDCFVEARVKGRSRPFYKVEIRFKPLPKDEARLAIEALEKDPMIAARVAAGEMPGEYLDALDRADIDLTPRAWDSMKRSCTCPDWGDPCKHMAAVFLVLAREIDRDPTILFKLRGIDLGPRIGGASPVAASGAKAVSAPPTAEARVAAIASSLPDPLAPETLPEGIEKPAAPAEGRPESVTLPQFGQFIVSLLPKKPPFGGTDFTVALSEFYHHAYRASRLGDAAIADRVDGELERVFSASRFRIEPPARLSASPGARRAFDAAAKYASGARGSARSKGRSVAERAFEARVRSGAIVEVEKPSGKKLSLPFREALSLFLGFEDDSGAPEFRYLFHLARTVRAIERAQAFVPRPELERGFLSIRWRPFESSSDVAEALESLARYEPGLIGAGGDRVLPGIATTRLLVADALDSFVRELRFVPAGARAGDQDLRDAFFAGGAFDATRPGERGLPAAVGSYLAPLALEFGARRYRLDVGARKAGFSLSMSVVPGASRAAKDAIPLRDAVAAEGLNALSVPNALAAYLPELRSLATRKSVALSEESLARFLGDASTLLSRIGVDVVLPKALHRELVPKPVLKASAKASGALTSYLGLDAMLDYDWRIAVGDALLTREEFKAHSESKKGVVFFKDGFVKLDPAEAARMLAATKGAPTALEAIKARATGEASFDADAEALVASLFSPRALRLPKGLAATLRPYQERGYRWAMGNLLSGFGCVIADDMGLGKTLQAIAVTLKLKEDGLLGQGALVVAPAALLGNWERELARFAPSLAVARYHGAGRRLKSKADVHLTTYGTATRDAAKLKATPFSLLIADEAHLMKNDATKQSRAVKALPASRVLALSGTPVENRLEDLRSLFDFAIPGYLGAKEEFKRSFRIPIEVERNGAAAARLKALTSPFLLRRLKTDPSVVPDLPQKVVTTEYATLAPEQAALYQTIVDANLDACARARGKERSALVLKLLTALKQTCDHPRLYDGESPDSPSLSGKCALLLELLGEMLAAREKVLVFSQYVGALELLNKAILDGLGERAEVYHGRMGESARQAAVDRFQGDPAVRVMLVSLKAGGLGLNLTAASRVVHFDLWYNPAVENQATDRAYRIGQTRNVFVHRIVAAGTFEEKIDRMLADKRELAEMTVASGETWISKLGETELRSLFER